MEKNPIRVIFKDAGHTFKKDELGKEIARIAFPAALALMADPIASLVDTAFIGRIGPVELAAVGVSIAIFNQVSRIAIFPLVSITTSFVAEDDANCTITRDEIDIEETRKSPLKEEEMNEMLPRDDPEKQTNKPLGFVNTKTNDTYLECEKRHIPSAYSALVFGSILGLLQAVILIFGARSILSIMGVKHGSPMLTPAEQYLKLRSLGSPAVLLSLATQGVFRGFKDTKTPLFATVIGDATNIILDPIFMFVLKLGVRGAAIAHVVSQYLLMLILLWRLCMKIKVVPPSITDLQYDRFLKNGFLLLARVIAVTFCVTLAASMAAREGSVPMAAFQVCLQVWLTTSLLADGLAVAGQAILASAFAVGDHEKARITATRVLQLGLALGLILSVVLGLGLRFGGQIFTRDVHVLHLMRVGIPFVAITQPINSLAFVFDGLNFGASDFAYSAWSMVLVAIASIGCLILLSWSKGFIGIWIALTIYMSLRMLAGFWRIGTATGPWKFLRT
ncbi:protein DETOXIFICATION 42 isoform X2 [Amborella trichopoda]|uniref:Protein DETOXIFICATION n=1 Tax=Amborella trichopoda TaxID=13333 RepID=W1PP65_AMBTC|nr:protein DETOXIFICATION 42 isoform X2 [Amborella trichopoda]ERN11797.1 hypothetical protein AMTR_s00022p00252850 [Amborella trichopoda]|eukprot:XP_006850216.1 protein DETOXIFICATION 42 isoform X2 [Amborella trichopoda]